MKYPKCQSENKVKNGIVRDLQRYKCKSCVCNYTISYEENSEKEKKRRFALLMYLECLVFHSIARLLGVSHVSVLKRFGVMRGRTLAESFCGFWKFDHSCTLHLTKPPTVNSHAGMSSVKINLKIC